MYQNPEELAGEFMNNPRARDEVIDGLVAGSNRIFLNIPRYGPARRISKLLRRAPFSDFYEFEKGLARRLHPILARLNLNVFSEFLINNLFFERYRLYSPDVNRIVEGDPEPDAGAFEEIMTSMAEREGHQMGVKFCDLVVRNIDRALFRTLRSVELALVEMKKTIVDDEGADRERAERIAGELRDQNGNVAAGIFLRRLEGASSPGSRLTASDSAGMDDTRPSPVESSSRGGIEETTGEPHSHGIEGRIRDYAEVLRRDSLDRIDGSDETRLRRLINAVFRKNEMRFGAAEARAITLGVLRAWAGDGSIEESKRRLFKERIDEWSGSVPAAGMEVPEDREEGEIVQSGDEVSLSGDTGMEMPAEEAVEVESQDESFLIDEAVESGGGDVPEIAVDADMEEAYLINGDAEFEVEGVSDPGGSGAADPGPSFPAATVLDEDLDPGVIGDGDIPVDLPEEDDTFMVRDEVLYEDNTLEARKKKSRGGSDPPSRDPDPDHEGKP